MRILVISNLYPPVGVGGYETRCAHTMSWVGRQHDVLVLTSSLKRRDAPAQEGILRELPYVPESRAGVLKAPLASLRAVRTLRRVMDDFRPGLVFVWNPSEIPRAIVRAAQCSGVPVALSIADPWPAAFVEGDMFLRYVAAHARGVRRLWCVLARLINRVPSLRVDLNTPLPAALVWGSGALRRMTAVPPLFVPVLDSVIYPSSRNEQLFLSVERRPAATPTIAFVGRIEPEKAPDVAVRALSLLSERHRVDARLLVLGAGDASARRELEQLARSLGVADRVELRGQVPPAGVAAALGEAHAMLVPSRWQEPFGLVCLEAALAGVPLVASLSGGMPEMLAPNDEALFFEIDDVEACAAALASVLKDPRAAEVRACRARTHAERDYSLDRYQELYDRFVEEALASVRAAGACEFTPIDGA